MFTGALDGFNQFARNNKERVKKGHHESTAFLVDHRYPAQGPGKSNRPPPSSTSTLGPGRFFDTWTAILPPPHYAPRLLLSITGTHLGHSEDRPDSGGGKSTCLRSTSPHADDPKRSIEGNTGTMSPSRVGPTPSRDHQFANVSSLILEVDSNPYWTAFLQASLRHYRHWRPRRMSGPAISTKTGLPLDEIVTALGGRRGSWLLLNQTTGVNGIEKEVSQLPKCEAIIHPMRTFQRSRGSGLSSTAQSMDVPPLEGSWKDQIEEHRPRRHRWRQSSCGLYAIGKVTPRGNETLPQER
ncbi:hypothetical protein C8F04DRAFT_1195667 [Mycena alexandri]|uniref:Uncharacterized protein n=1 Tax=Mycena alexandri TaxID=1745969 RepID=A0AAD6WUB5_9AGAR|nr:hypothetical protein C8F04DRAFT_1195667 [Mycena alexandri]